MTESTASTESATETRDYLALVRTDLANERTLLAYGRTALMVSATGVSLLEFFPESPVASLISWPLVASGALIAMLGLVRFLVLRSRLRAHPANAHAPK